MRPFWLLMDAERGSEVLSGGGDMGALARTVDWSRTPVGPVDGWPQSLRTAVSILLESKFPMLLCWGPDFVQFYNDPFRPILGVSKHPAFGHRAEDTFSEAWHIVGPLFAQVMDGTAVGFEDMLVPLDRYGFLEECYFTYSYSPIRDETGGIGGLLVTCTETSMRVIAERRLRTLRELASEAAHARVENAAWQSALDVLARSTDIPAALLYALDADGVEAHLAGASGIEGAPSVVRAADVIAAWPRSSNAPAASLVLPITRPDLAQPYGFLVAGLSPQLRLDDKYREFLALVADQIATAVANAAQNERLVSLVVIADDARRAAEAASRAKDEFLAMLGHELRNPLAPILTALQLMTLRGDRGAEKERAIIDRQVRHVVRLVDDLLDVSRIARDKIDLKRSRVELAEVVAKAVEMTSPVIEQKQHTLEIDVAPIGLVLDADQTRLQQVVFNLLYNAAKYTEPQGHIAIEAARRADIIELRIRDSGVGIDPELLPQVFDLFFQDRQEIDRAQGGLGLGLAIVRNLVELHGGHVSASSAGRGRGSEFIVTLPAASPQLVHTTMATSRPPTRVAAGGMRVLIVDDNEDAASMLADALQIAGFITQTAADGQLGLEAAVLFAPDAAVLDLGLPHMDGYELAARLRQRDRPPMLIAVTGYGAPADRQRTETSGFDAHLVKPIDVDDLIMSLRRLQARRCTDEG